MFLAAAGKDDPPRAGQRRDVGGDRFPQPSAKRLLVVCGKLGAQGRRKATAEAEQRGILQEQKSRPAAARRLERRAEQEDPR
jgi:hypothetical protein